MTSAPVPVAIVGAGGAGLALTLLLHQQGIASVVVERRTDISWVPRARNLNFRTLEVFRGLGFEEDVLAAGSTVSHGFRKVTLASAEQEEILDVSALEPPGLQLTGSTPRPGGRRSWARRRMARCWSGPTGSSPGAAGPTCRWMRPWPGCSTSAIDGN